MITMTARDQVWMAADVPHGVAHEVLSWDPEHRQAKLLCGWTPPGGTLVDRARARYELNTYGCALCHRLRNGRHR